MQWKEQQSLKTVEYICLIYYQHSLQAHITLEDVLYFVCQVGTAFVISSLIFSQLDVKRCYFSSFVSFLPQTWVLNSGAFLERQVHTCALLIIPLDMS